MPHDLFDRLDDEWRTVVRHRDSHAALKRWQRAYPSLARFADLDALFAALGRHRDPQQADLMRILIRLAKTDPVARRVALQALVPGLARVARKYRTWWGSDESAAMVLHFALERLARWNDHRPASPAAAIVLEANRHLYVTYRRETTQRAGLGSEASFDDLVACAETSDVNSSETLAELLIDAVDEARITQAEAQLIYLTRVVGIATATLAIDAGRQPAVIRQRRRQAERALVAAMPEVA